MNNKFLVTYVLISPSQERYQPIYFETFAQTADEVKLRIEAEFKRRLGNLYQWEIEIHKVMQEQLALF